MSDSEYGAEDFLENPKFRAWVRTPTPETNAYWQEFLRQHPASTEAIAKARNTLWLIDERTEARFPTDEQVHRMFGTISERTQEMPVRSLWSMTWQWVAAAGVVMAIGLGWWLQTRQTPSHTLYQQLTAQAPMPLIEKVNPGSRPLRVALQDGSTVTLQPNSRISYTSSIATSSQRYVYLTGEAFFEVAKSPQKPFFVYANEIVTKVLGTSFRVRAFDNDQKVTVSVRTGKVSVFNRTDPNATRLSVNAELSGVILTPNQQLIFDRPDHRMQKTLVPHPEVVFPSAKPLSFTYQDVPVKQVFADLKKAYGIAIEYNEEILGHCLLTASLTEESLHEKLNLICKGIQAEYRVQDTRIIITGQGCP